MQRHYYVDSDHPLALSHGSLADKVSAEEVVHASLSVTAMSRVQQNLLFSSTYPQPTGRGDGALQVLVAGLWQGL